MKIGQHHPDIVAQGVTSSGASKAGSVAAASHGRDGTAVTLSAAATALLPALRSGQPFDAGKVAAVRASIDDGTYRINPGAIADKLLANVGELMGHR